MTQDDPTDRSSFTSLTLHRRCPQAWQYRYVQGYEQALQEPSIERDFGSWLHALRAAQSIEKGLAEGTIRYIPPMLKVADGGDPIPVDREDVVVAVGEAAADWWHRASNDYRDTWVAVLGEPLLDRLRYVADRYQERWAEELELERVLAVELPFSRELPGVFAADGRPARLTGTVDEVIEDTRRHLVVARDIKTGKTLPTVTAADNLMDSQLHLYIWGAAPLLAEWGFKVQAVSYDRVRSMPPKSPAVTAAGNLAKNVTDYDLHTYATWAAGPDGLGVPWGEGGAYLASGPRKGQPKFGRYVAEESVIAKLSSPDSQADWFQRSRMPLNLNVVKAHLRAALDTHQAISSTMARVQRSGEASRNFDRCMCGWCDYEKLCLAQIMGGPQGEYPLDQFGLVQA